MLFLFPFFVKADTLGQENNFIVEKSYSESGEQTVKATLVKVGDGLYFYVEDAYWKTLNQKEKEEALASFSSLDLEFIGNIKPKLSSAFGSESSPGIDNDKRITALFYPLKGSARGYIRNIDNYGKANNPTSNEREMVYLNSLHVNNQFLKEFFTHEYMHLITINQKEKRLGGKSEEVWLNEALSEYAVTYAGYNQKDNSYIDNRINVFINNPSDSLTDWNNQIGDYGSVTIFTHYLVEKYGVKVLADTLKSSKTGIDAINESLKNNGFKETAQEVYTNFTVAVYLNDCSASDKFCFKDQKLSKLHILTLNNFLPISGDSNIFLGQTISPYSAQYQKFIGGSGDLKFTFKGKPTGFFTLYYVIKKMDGEISVDYLKMPVENQEGEIVIKSMDKEVSAIIFIPSVVTYYGNSKDTKFYYSLGATNFTAPKETLPIKIDKPLDQMTKQELVTTIIRLLIYVLSQQPKYAASSVIY
ncbi:MAG: hypothetical protein PHW52_00750 [Candidatus Pacebacteria bacterium]|nr:hypothetical protein [Candidatus Paceibacterota bacterium]